MTFSPEKFGLSWPGKAASLEEAQVPAKGVLIPCPEESVNFDETKNIFIEGENLEVLKILQEEYLGKIKMIYIDPPYNTGKKRGYNDNYAETPKEYFQRTGQKDKPGMRHSKWLSMMYPRLYLAKNLLKEDGVIFISIDDHEQHHLRSICDQIFGEENFVANIVWEKKYAPSNNVNYFSDIHDFIICYCKNKENWKPNLLIRTKEANERYKNPDNDPRGVWKSSDLSVTGINQKNIYTITNSESKEIIPPNGRSWAYSKEKLQQLIKENRIWFGISGNNIPSLKRFLSEVKEGITPLTLWKYSEVGHTQDARKETKKLFDDQAYFDYPKPVSLIGRMLQLSNLEQTYIVLDFFAGSATAAHAVMQQNAENNGECRYIMVQLPEPCAADSTASKAGYKTIADIAKERIRRAGSKIAKELEASGSKHKPDLGFKVFKLAIKDEEKQI